MTLHVERLGTGAPLALLHGWGFHSSAWDGFADDLARHYEGHLVDLPGHGRSAGVGGTFETAVDAVAAAVPDDSVVCGWSLGGLFALAMAVEHPRKVRALVLLGATPCFLAQDDWPNGVGAETLEAFAGDLRESPERTLKRFVHLNTFDVEETRPAIRALVARLAERPFPARAALDAGLAWLRATDLRAQVPGLRIPSLVIHGDRDRIVPPGAGAWLARNLPAGRLVALSRSAHLPFVTDRAACVDAIRAFDA